MASGPASELTDDKLQEIKADFQPELMELEGCGCPDCKAMAPTVLSLVAEVERWRSGEFMLLSHERALTAARQRERNAIQRAHDWEMKCREQQR